MKYLFLIILLTACSSDVVSESSDLKQNLLAGHEEFKLRKFEADILPLEVKERRVYDRFKKNFLVQLDDKTQLFVKRHNHILRYEREVFVEDAAYFLIYLSKKFEITQDKEFVEIAEKVINGIIFLDEQNGVIGDVPDSAEFLHDGLVLMKEDLKKVDNFSNLLIAYSFVVESFDSDKLNSKISKHTEEIFNFIIRNASPELGRLMFSRDDFTIELNGRNFVSSVSFLVESERLKNVVLQLEKEKFKDKIKNGSFANWVKTNENNFYNGLQFYNLVRLKKEQYYFDAFAYFHKAVRQKENVFFDLLYVDLFPVSKKKYQKNIKRYLNSFPVSSSDVAILYNDKIGDKSLLPVYGKFQTSNEWKQDMFRISGNKNGKGEVEFSGVDFLLAYILYHKIYEVN